MFWVAVDAPGGVKGYRVGLHSWGEASFWVHHISVPLCNLPCGEFISEKLARLTGATIVPPLPSILDV